MDTGLRYVYIGKMDLEGKLYEMSDPKESMDETLDVMSLDFRGLISRAGNFVNKTLVADTYNGYTNDGDRGIIIDVGSNIRPVGINNKIKAISLQLTITDISVKNTSERFDCVILADDSQLVDDIEDISNMIANSYSRLLDIILVEQINKNKETNKDDKTVMTSNEIAEAAILMFTQACSAIQSYLKKEIETITEA